MSHPGLRDQDYLLQLGKLGVYHAEIEYDQLQHLYCDVNPFNNNIGILLQRLRFSGYYSPTLDITLFAEDQFLRRTGWQAASNNVGPRTPYNFTTYLRPIDYKQNDLRVGAEYDQPTDQKSIFQGRLLMIFRPLRMVRQTLWAGSRLPQFPLRGGPSPQLRAPLTPCPQAIWPTTLPLRGHWT